MIDYIIPEKYKGKKVKLPRSSLENVCNDDLVLSIPENACYLCVGLFEPLGPDGKPLSDSDNQLDMLPYLIYLDSKKRNIDETEILNIDTFSLDRRLELIFEKYKEF